jgi:hypothetical protein
VNRPSSAFGLLLGFLALTMFAVSSTSRSTTIKPAASYADRAAIRRQAALSRMSALAAAAENMPAGNLFDDDALCVPDSIDEINATSAAPGESKVLKMLRGAAATRLTPVHIETIRADDSSLTMLDGRTHDVVYDLAVLGIVPAQSSEAPAIDREDSRELSATDITTVFQSVMREGSAGSRNATRKSQRRASLSVPRFLADAVVPML